MPLCCRAKALSAYSSHGVTIGGLAIEFLRSYG